MGSSARVAISLLGSWCWYPLVLLLGRVDEWAPEGKLAFGSCSASPCVLAWLDCECFSVFMASIWLECRKVPEAVPVSSAGSRENQATHSQPPFPLHPQSVVSRASK